MTKCDSRDTFIREIKKLEVYAKKNGIDIIYKINNPRKIRDDTEKGYVFYTSFGAEIFPLEPEIYLDGKRYPYYPNDPGGLLAYDKLSENWKSLGHHHSNDAFRSWFDD